jgi:2-polyprenyl-3-methyl-5-hydroxy-6-metoxy-1,4-benzoquinol methylase
MQGNIHLSKCPACNALTIKQIISAIDYTVSNQSFEIWHCNICTLRFTQNIPDINHIGPFYQSNSYVSHSDTKKGLINRLYHIVRNYTLQSKQQLIRKITKKSVGKLLDIGAGTGAFAKTMKSKDWEVIGLEPDASARNLALQNYALVLNEPAQIDHLEAQTFDAITLWHVLEHVHDLTGYWEHFKRLIAPQGKLVIAVPNYTSYDAGHYQQYWAAYDVPRHLYHFSPESMEKLASINGFKLIANYPMWFDSFYVSMLSEQYKNGKSNLIKAFYIGLMSNIKTLFNAKKCSSIIYIFEPIN